VRPDGGIVYQDVDAAERGERPRHHRVDLILPGDIGDDGERLDPAVLGCPRDLVGIGLVGAGVDDDVSPFSGQLQYRRTADIAARSGHQGDFPVELTHQRTSVPMQNECSSCGAGASHIRPPDQFDVAVDATASCNKELCGRLTIAPSIANQQQKLAFRLRVGYCPVSKPS